MRYIIISVCMSPCVIYFSKIKCESVQTEDFMQLKGLIVDN